MSTYSVDADIDSHMTFEDPNVNYGSSLALDVLILIIGGEKALMQRAILNFDLSGYPGEADGSDITAVKLVLDATLAYSGGDQMDFNRCTRPDTWVESGVTWYDYNAGPWISSGGDLTVTDEVTWNITVGPGIKNIPGFKDLTVDALVNRGDILSLIAKLDNEADTGSSRGIIVHSTESTTGAKPTLVITYGAANRSGARALVGVI